MDELPIYNITIDPEYQTGENELGWDETAITTDPAIMLKGMAYKSHAPKQMFADEKKYRITAPAMIPMDIYRADEDGEYEVRFTEETIEDLFKKYMSNLNNSDKFNSEHNGAERVPAYMLECWLVDSPKEDKAFSTFGLEVPKGTLMFTLQFTDKDFYNKAVEEDRVGLSIEGFLGLSLPKEQLNKYSMKLPDGEHTIDGSIYTVENGEITNVVEVVAEETSVEEEVVAEVEVEAPVAEVAMEDEEKEDEEVELADESEEEEKEEEVEMEVNPEADAEAILAIVNPLIEEKINAVLEVIADLQNEMAEAGEVPQSEDAEVNMSGHVGFSRFAQAFREQN